MRGQTGNVREEMHGRAAARVLRPTRARGASRCACPSAARARPRAAAGPASSIASATAAADAFAAVFYGLGSDGTVSANKNSIKIVGEATALHAQGYFVYDSKKSGSRTVSHLRFGPDPIRAPYLVSQADFVGCHQFRLLDQVDVLGRAAPGASLLLNCPLPPDRVWDALSRGVQQQILDKDVRLYTVDANRIARAAGLPGATATTAAPVVFAGKSSCARTRSSSGASWPITTCCTRPAATCCTASAEASGNCSKGAGVIVVKIASIDTDQPGIGNHADQAVVVVVGMRLAHQRVELQRRHWPPPWICCLSRPSPCAPLPMRMKAPTT